MGYYTFHSLAAAKAEVGKSEDDLYFHSISENRDGGSGFPQVNKMIRSVLNRLTEMEGYCPLDEDTKWYDADDHMKLISLEHPDFVFMLYANGESTDDISYTYYYRGKRQNCPVRMEFDKLDWSKLK